MNSRIFFYEFGKLIYNIDGFYAEYAKEKSVKPNLLWILYALNDGQEHSQKEICDTWDLPRTTINTIIKELEADGYVFLSQIIGEKRELSVKLTDEGKKYASSMLQELYEIEEKVYESIKNGGLLNKRLNELLNGLYEIKEEILKSKD